MNEDEQRGPDWRWFAGGAIALVGTLVSVVLYLHTGMEEMRNKGQDDRMTASDTRVSTLESDVRGIRDIAAKIPVMDVKITVGNEKLDRLEAGMAKLNDRLEARAEVRAEQRDDKPPGKK